MSGAAAVCFISKVKPREMIVSFAVSLDSGGSIGRRASWSSSWSSAARSVNVGTMEMPCAAGESYHTSTTERILPRMERLWKM